MRTPLRLAVFLLVALLARQAAADPIGPHFYVVPLGGFTVFDGSFRFPNNTPLRDAYYVGGRAGYQAKSWLGIEAAGGYTPTEEDLNSGGQDVRFTHGSLSLMFTPYSGRFGGPFIQLGGGGSKLQTTSGPSTDLNQGNFEFGGGVLFWMTDALALRFEARDLNWLGKDEITKPLTHTLVFGAGVTVAIGGKPRDTDADGVPDSKDTCPNTPHGATVDANGCPHDADGDGVLDGIDRCAGTPKGATIDSSGCSHDSDADGIADGLDQCADTPRGATIDSAGCPHDADGDGVLDGLDKCPDTPKGATIDSTGCPDDADGDGVFDGLDKCPDTAAGLKVDSTGCSVEYQRLETEMLDTGMIRLWNVSFQTGKAALLPESYPTIDLVGELFRKWPDLKIEIGGHTDSRGATKANQKLSEGRVESVLSHLLEKFPDLKREQFVTKGYGESQPLVPETNDQRRAKNRRVEFKVLNTDVLRREVEKRKPAPK